MRYPLLAVLTAASLVSPAYALPVVDQTGNLIANGNFEAGNETPVTSGYATAAASPLAGWNQWANSGPVTTAWADAPLIEGNHLARVTGNSNDGLYQYSYGYNGTYTLSAWVYVVTGSAHLILAGNSGSLTSIGSASSQTGQWEYLTLSASMNGSLGGPVLYAAADNSEFYIDGVWFNAGAASTSPFDPATGFNPNPVPEPETYALMLAGLALVGFAARRPGAVPFRS